MTIETIRIAYYLKEFAFTLFTIYNWNSVLRCFCLKLSAEVNLNSTWKFWWQKIVKNIENSVLIMNRLFNIFSLNLDRFSFRIRVWIKFSSSNSFSFLAMIWSDPVLLALTQNRYTWMHFISNTWYIELLKSCNNNWFL